jgi:hypothetical protein
MIIIDLRGRTMSEQDGRQATALQCPTTPDPGAWKAYWKTQGQLWRTEPEIDEERQTYLTVRRSITPDTEKGIYPFKGIELSRADVEWLLATHDNGQGPVDWNKERESQSDPYIARKGLDFRGVDLRSKDLHSLPLARLIGYTTERSFASNELHEAATIQLEGADLSDVHLEGATLPYAYLQGANLYRAHLEKANLYRARLEGARFTGS